MTTLVKIDEYWVNPETITYLQPGKSGIGSTYINFGPDNAFVVIKDKTPDEVAELLHGAGAVILRNANDPRRRS